MQSVPSDCETVLMDYYVVLSIYTARFLELQFVPTINTTRSLRLQFVPSINTMESRERAVYLFLFVCLFTLWRRHHYRWGPSNFDLNSALKAIYQWGFFSVPHLLWYGSSFYNGHLQGSVTLAPVAVRLTVELSLPV